MKKIKTAFVFVLLILSSNAQLFAQQNLFNIPSGDITGRKEIFYQHQINIFKLSDVESKSHFVYGLGKGWDVGVNLINIKFDFKNRSRLVKLNDNPANNAIAPLMLLTAQKGFNISHKFKFNVGTQLGTNIVERGGGNHLGYFNYGLFHYEFLPHSRVMFGGYNTNNAFVGKGNNYGYLLGYEIKLHKRWYLMGDFISGNHSNSVAVLGGMYNISKRVQFCAGVLLPNFKNQISDNGFVLELNILSWDYWNDKDDEHHKKHLKD